MVKMLITGGAGFIGSGTALRLVESGHEVVVLDSLTSPRFMGRIRKSHLRFTAA